MQSKFTRAALIGLAAATVLGTAGTAAAHDLDPKTERAATAKAAKSGKVKADQRYCVDGAHTGSRIKHRTCLTASEWSVHGVDIVAEAARGNRR